MNHDCDEASTKTSTEQIIHAFLVNWDRPREQYGYTLHHGSLDHCSSLPRGLCLCLLPLTGHSSAAVAGSYFKVNPSLWPPWPIPQWLWFSESQILILKVLKGSPWTVPIASLSGPFCFTPPQSTWLRSPWSSLPLKHTKHIFWQTLLNASLSQRVSLTLYHLLNPHHSLSSWLSSRPGIGFSHFYCLSPS